MEIIRNNIDELIDKIGYKYKNEYSNKKVNTLFNYWMFFDEKEEEIIKLLNLSLDVFLYSKWYWSERYVVCYEEEYGKEVPADWGQYQYESTLENFEHRIKEPDWYVIGAIYNEIHNSECKCIDCKTKRWKV